MKNSYFVTGTDTDIGKTVVATALAIGLGSSYWKPVQTGSADGTDTEFVRKWIGPDRTPPESYVFQESLSPHLAARLGVRIEIEKILTDFRKIPRPLIVEGAGGVFVPLNSTEKVIDLIESLSLPAILVASTRLGTINHTLLSLEALKAHGIPVAGVITVGNESPATQWSIEHYGGAPVLGHVPRCPSFSIAWFRETFQRINLSHPNNGAIHV